MFRYLRYVLVVLALLAGGLLVACGSDDDGDGNGSDDNGIEQPVDADDNGDGDNGDGDGDDDSTMDISDELRDLASRFGIQEVKVTYSFSGSGVGGEDSQMIIYSKPPDRWRMDILSSEGDISMISDGDSTLICSSADGEGQCFESPLDDTIEIPFLSIFTDPDEFSSLIDESLGVDVVRSSRTIAGQDATCFSFSGDVDGTEGAGEFCFRDDGVLLLLRADAFDGEEAFTLEATEVSNSVSDSDLEAPYDILDLGDFGDLIP